jgi:hypothetical protein
VKRQAYVLAILVVVLALSVAVTACGEQESASDPLVGTWRLQAADGSVVGTPLIITKSGAGYVATLVFWGDSEGKPASPGPTEAISLKRQGDTLTGVFTDLTLRVEIVYLPGSGKITFAGSRTPDGPLSKPDTMVKVSPGTAYPSTF